MTEQEKITVVIVDDIDESREMILRMLQFEPAIEVIGSARSGRQAIELAEQLKPDVMVMDINMPDMDGITATEAIRKKVPFIQVVILSVQNDPNYMRRAMLAGARDFLSKPPLIDELTTAVRRAGDLALEEKSKFVVAPFNINGAPGAIPLGMVLPNPPSGKIIVVYSPKGGVGTTTVATNLATLLKTEQNKVALVDANLLFGDVAVFFNEHARNSFLELLEHSHELDPEIIEDVMAVNQKTGIHIMTAPKQPEFGDGGKGQSISRILTYMRQLYNFIVVDSSTYLTEVVQTCLDIADLIILVTTQDIPAIKNAHQFLSLADASGIERERILFVMNRYDRRVAITPEKVGATLKQPVRVSIPFEDRIISNAVNRGVPFILENKNLLASKAMVTLADQVKESVTLVKEEIAS